MAIINDKRCKVCNSEYRNKIEKLLSEGMSARKISDYINDEYGENISHNSINTHKKKHWNVNKEVQRVKIQEESKELFQEKVKEGLTRLDSLKHERSENLSLANKLRLLIDKIIDQLTDFLEGKTKKLKINPEVIKGIQALYNTATNGVRYSASEEYKQLEGGNEDDPFKILMDLMSAAEDDKDGLEEDEETS
jgi:hypothetical protein